MHGLPLLIGLFLSAYLGFALLALSQTRHWRAVSSRAQPPFTGKLLLRGFGAICLLLALGLALLRDGPSFGAVLWATLISLAGAAVAFTLSGCPRLFRVLTMITNRGAEEEVRWPSDNGH